MRAGTTRSRVHADGRALEPAAGLAYKTRAQTYFVHAIERNLPDACRKELEAIPNNRQRERAVRSWARRWRVECGCAIDWANGQVIIRSIVGPSARLSQRFGYDLPAEWWKTLEELNNTILLPDGGDPRDLGKCVDAGVTTSPIAGNPLMESRDLFLQRAAAHWDARAAMARGHGYKPIAQAPELEKHTEWLARQRLLGTSVSALATEANQTPDSVRKALTSVRRAIGLMSRLSPGRPKGLTVVPKV